MLDQLMLLRREYNAGNRHNFTHAIHLKRQDYHVSGRHRWQLNANKSLHDALMTYEAHRDQNTPYYTNTHPPPGANERIHEGARFFRIPGFIGRVNDHARMTYMQHVIDAFNAPTRGNKDATFTDQIAEIMAVYASLEPPPSPQPQRVDAPLPPVNNRRAVNRAPPRRDAHVRLIAARFAACLFVVMIAKLILSFVPRDFRDAPQFGRL